MKKGANEMKEYYGLIPACGAFCGGCPTYLKERNPCPGAEKSDRCKSCKSYYLCCTAKGHRFCFECEDFPCRRLRSFARRWRKYGQNFIENQKELKAIGEEAFLKKWNNKIQTVNSKS